MSLKEFRATMALLELVRENGVAVGILSDILVVYYETTPTFLAVEAMESASKRITGLESLSALIVIEASARTPEQSVRNAIQKSMQRVDSKTDAIAYAILGGGFSGAATRAAISGILMFVRPSYPAKVFSSVHQAVAWLQQFAAGSGALPREDCDEIVDFCSAQRRKSA